MHQVLSNAIKIVIQLAVIVIVPGGLPAVLIYQYRRLQKRRRDALERRSQPRPLTDEKKEIFPESPQ